MFYHFMEIDVIIEYIDNDLYLDNINSQFKVFIKELHEDVNDEQIDKIIINS